MRNWAGNLTFSTDRLARPGTVAQVQELVAAGGPVRALGSAHSFSTVADTTGTLLSVEDLEGDAVVDEAAQTVSFPAGWRYARLNTWLEQRGLAVHNTGSLPHISVAGACATGTHGSGNHNANLPSAVEAVRFVDGRGELVELSRAAHPDTFGGAVLALGALGVVVGLTVRVEPSYQVRQDVYLDVPLERLLGAVDDVFAAAYSVSVFTDWSRPDVIDKIWLKRRTGDDSPAAASWLGGSLAEVAQHPVRGEDASAATQQLGIPGPWLTRLPHFRAEFTPSTGDEIQTEYLLPRAAAADAIAALAGLAADLRGPLLVCEFRTIAADELWLSPSHERDSVALHFTWANDIDAVRPVLGLVEKAIAAHDPRPHWGKVFTIPAEQVRAQYPQLKQFQELVEEHDPERRFGNPFLEQYVY